MLAQAIKHRSQASLRVLSRTARPARYSTNGPNAGSNTGGSIPTAKVGTPSSIPTPNSPSGIPNSSRPGMPPGGPSGGGNSRNQKSSFFGTVTVPMVALASVPVFIAYKADTDPETEQTLATEYPTVLASLGPVREVLREWGLTTKPQPPKPVSRKEKKEAKALETAKEQAVKAKESTPEAAPVAPVVETAPVAVAAVEEPVATPPTPTPEPTPAAVEVASSAAVVADDNCDCEHHHHHGVHETTASTESDHHHHHHQHQEQHQQPPVEVHEIEVQTDTPPEESVIPKVPSEILAQKAHSDSMGAMIDELALESAGAKKELQQTVLNDLDKLDANGLRVRIHQLAAEFFERARWEGVRMQQALKQAESELAHKYETLRFQQRAELESEISKIMLQRQQAMLEETHKQSQENMLRYESLLSEALRTQADEFAKHLDEKVSGNAESLRSKYDGEIRDVIANMTESHSRYMDDLESRLRTMQSQLKEFAQIVDESSKVQDRSIDIHKESAALMSLETALSTSQPIAAYVNKYKSTVGSDDVLAATALKSIPEEVLTRGVPTVSELKVRFALARDEARKVALSPQNIGSPVIEHAIGSVLSRITSVPSGYIEGEGAEEVLSRASYFLDNGTLSDALRELEGIKGYGKVLLSDWETAAKNRLVAEQALKALRANSVLKHKSMTSQ